MSKPQLSARERPRTVRIPRQRGRRSQPFVLVMSERPSLSRQVLLGLARIAWDHRRALAPIPLAVLALAITALLHVTAWWAGFVLAPAALAPLVWLAAVQRRHPARGSALAWRTGLSAIAALAAGWTAAGTLAGPFTGPLELVWLLALAGTQSAWLIARRTH